MRSALVITAVLGLGLAAHGQIPVEVRPAEAVDPFAAPTPEVRRAEPVTPAAPASATALPPVDPTDGTEAIRAAPSNLPADPARQAFEQANAFYGQKMYDLAVPKYQLFLASALRSMDRQAALFRLGECLRALKRPQEASVAYRELLSEYNTGDFMGPAAYRLGEIQYGAREFDAAATSFRLSAHHVRDAKLRLAAKFFEGRALDAAGRKIEALSAYREVAAQKENNPYRDRAIFDLAEADARAGLTDSAFRQLRGLAETAQTPPVRISAAVKAGLLAIDLRDFESARPLLEMGAANQELANWRAAAQAGLVRLEYESENYPAAAARAEEALPLLPAESQPDVLLLAANARRQMGEQARALTLYDRLVAEYPNSQAARDAGFHRLVSLVAQRDERAPGQIDAFLASTNDEEDRAKAALLKAELLFGQDRFAEAAELYRQASTARGTEKYRSDALYKLAWCQLQTKSYDEAVEVLTRFLLQYPRHPRAASAYAQRALAQMETGDNVAALADFEVVINKHREAKEREDAMVQRALILGNLQRSSEMAAGFQRLLEEYPQTKSAAQAHFWIGYAATEAKKHREAIAPLEKARELDAKKYGERATLRLLLSHYNLQDREAVAREARALGPDKAPVEVREWLGLSALEAGDNKTAAEFLAPLAAADGATPELRLSLAQAQLGAGQFKEARATLEQVLPKVHEPRLKARTHLLMAETLIGLRDGAAAKAQAEEAQRLQPEGRLNAEARLANGRALLAQEKFDDAARAFMAIALLYDEKDLTPQALVLAEEAYKRAANTADAQRAREELQRRYPDYKPPAQS
jgi:TolA-binding protein